MSELGPCERYRPLIDDWPEFAAAARRPLAPCVWANPLRADADRLAGWLRAAGMAGEPIPWLPGAFELTVGTSAGNLLAFAAGLCHVQESVSLLPARLLGARPGERILDLCAAPGGKTAAIAAALGGRGLVIANDRDRGRLGPLRRTLARLGISNAAVTCWDAASYPRAAGLFDRVLADVPCSCEGTSRKNPEVLRRRTDRQHLVSLQCEILASAARRCRPGGRIVYSTCTYAPEENEGVIDSVLRSRDDLRVHPVRPENDLPGLRSEGGLTFWQGRRFHPGLAGALRIWPHHNDTGGFFVAVLRKAATGGAAAAPEAGPAHPGAEGVAEGWRSEAADAWLGPQIDRFGFPADTFAGFHLMARGRKRLSILRAGSLLPAAPELLALGLPFLRTAGRSPKMTTAACMAFGARATRNRVAVDRAGAALYLARREAPPSAVDEVADSEPGPVMVAHRGAVLGMGLLAGDGALSSLYPKAWRLRTGKPGDHGQASMDRTGRENVQ